MVVPDEAAAEIIPVSNEGVVASSATATTSLAFGFCLLFEGERRRDASHLEPVRLLMLTGVVGPGECAMPPSSVTAVVPSEHAVLDPAEKEDAEMLDGPAAVVAVFGGCGGLRLLVGGEDAALVSLLRVKSLDRGGVAGGPFAAA